MTGLTLDSLAAKDTDYFFSFSHSEPQSLAQSSYWESWVEWISMLLSKLCWGVNSNETPELQKGGLFQECVLLIRNPRKKSGKPVLESRASWAPWRTGTMGLGRKRGQWARMLSGSGVWDSENQPRCPGMTEVLCRQRKCSSSPKSIFFSSVSLIIIT